MRSISRLRQCKLESRKGRLSPKEEPLATETYTNAKGNRGLRGAALFDRLDCGRRCGGTGVSVVKADQDLVGCVLQPRVGFVQLASRFARQLAKLITVGHMRECPKN